MNYCNIVNGIFKERINRFVSLVEISGKTERVHVRNTGRCKELLIPGVRVYLEDFNGRMGERKLRYSLVAVEKLSTANLINMDSMAPNKVVEESLISGKLKLPNMDELTHVQREKTFANSRFDFYVEDKNGEKAFIEVKGVTLEEDGIAKFPDAPTVRGVKHINELISAKKEGYKAYLILIIQMKKVYTFVPNYITHFEFGAAMKEAANADVSMLAYDCQVSPSSLSLGNPVPIDLS